LTAGIVQGDWVDIVGIATVQPNVQPEQSIYQLAGSESLQTQDSSGAPIHAISSQNIDDTSMPVSISISPARLMINPIGTKQVGDTFTISGSTNLAVGDDLIIEIIPPFQPTSKKQSSGFYGVNGLVKVVPGAGTANSWFFDVDTSAFTPGQYMVLVSGVLPVVKASATFNVVPASSSPSTSSVGSVSNATAVSTAAVTGTGANPPSENLTSALVTVSSTASNTTSGSPALPATTTYASLPAALGITGLAVALIIRRRW
jgi:hypothetical protein